MPATPAPLGLGAAAAAAAAATGPLLPAPLSWPQAVHPSAASLLADKEPASSTSSSSHGAPEDPAATGPQHIPGTTESVVFDSFARAAAQQRTPGANLKGVTRFLGFSGA